MPVISARVPSYVPIGAAAIFLCASHCSAIHWSSTSCHMSAIFTGIPPLLFYIILSFLMICIITASTLHAIAIRLLVSFLIFSYHTTLSSSDIFLYHACTVPSFGLDCDLDSSYICSRGTHSNYAHNSGGALALYFSHGRRKTYS